MLLKDIMSREKLYDPRNTSMVLCDAALDKALDMKALHLCQVRDRVCEQLIVKPVQPSSNKVLFGQQKRYNAAAVSSAIANAPKVIYTRVPNDYNNTDVLNRPTRIASLQPAGSNESLYPGMQKLPYIAPDKKFSLRADFLTVLRTLSHVNKAQIIFEYREVGKYLTSYILTNKNRLFDQRNIKVVLCEGDPLGKAFGVKAFYRSQVMAFLRTQLIELPAVESLPTSLKRTLSSEQAFPVERDVNGSAKRVKKEEENKEPDSSHSDSSISDTDVNEDEVENYSELDIDTDDDEPPRKRHVVYGSEDDTDWGPDGVNIVLPDDPEKDTDVGLADDERDEIGREKDIANIVAFTGLEATKPWRCLRCKMLIRLKSALCKMCYMEKKSSRPVREKKRKNKGKKSEATGIGSKVDDCPPVEENVKESSTLACSTTVKKPEGPTPPAEITFQIVNAWINQLAQADQDRVSHLSWEEVKKLYLCEQEWSNADLENDDEDEQDMCHFCFSSKKNAGLVHGRVVHRISCYPCAKKSFKQHHACPLCRRTIEKIVKVC